MQIKVKLNLKGIDGILNNAIIAFEQTAEATLTDIRNAQVMPFGEGSGEMQNNLTAVDTSDSKNGKARIVTQGPYARRLYFHLEYDFSQFENANARGEWLEPWIDGDKKDFAKKTFKEKLKKN